MNSASLKKYFFILLFTMYGFTFLAQNTLKTNPGLHGGKTKQAGNYFIEILDSPGNLYVFLLNSHLKSVSNKNIIGQMTFYFPEDVITDYPLSPYKTDGFFAECPNGFYSFKVTFDVENKKISALFDNYAKIVKKK